MSLFLAELLIFGFLVVVCLAFAYYYRENIVSRLALVLGFWGVALLFGIIMYGTYEYSYTNLQGVSELLYYISASIAFIYTIFGLIEIGIVISHKFIEEGKKLRRFDQGGLKYKQV